jgi:hypothetical protein
MCFYDYTFGLCIPPRDKVGDEKHFRQKRLNIQKFLTHDADFLNFSSESWAITCTSAPWFNLMVG